MFLSLFLTLLFQTEAKSKSIINIDIGSQFLKFGQTYPEDGYFVCRKLYNKYMVPGLITITTPKDISLPLQYDDVNKLPIKSVSLQTGSSISRRKMNMISILTGWRGNQQIHRYPQSGSEYIINSVIKRETPSNILNTSSLLALYMMNVLHDMPESKGVDQFSLTFPTFFTPSMRRLITEPLRQVTNFTIIEEFDSLRALTTFYSNYYINRYRKSKVGRNVLFVDIGFEYVETLFVHFEWKHHQTVARCISNMWSDKCGTHAFATDLSQTLHVPFTHAERSLKSTYNESVFNPVITNELKSLVNLTISTTNDPVDEVQLVGGGSSHFFIQSLISYSVNRSFRPNATRFDPIKCQAYFTSENRKKLVGAEKKIYPLDVSSPESTFDEDMKKTILTEKRKSHELLTSAELGQFDAVLKGSMLASLYNANNPITANNPIRIVRERSSANYRLNLGDKNLTYCEKNLWCLPDPKFTSVKEADNYTLDIVVDDDDTPAGAPKVANRYHLIGVDKLARGDGEDVTISLKMKTPEPFIDQARWCRGETCTKIGLRMESGDDLSNQILNNENYDLIRLFNRKLAESRIREDFESKLKLALDRMRLICKTRDNPSCPKVPIIREKFEKGEYNQVPLQELDDEVIPEISNLCKSLGFRFE